MIRQPEPGAACARNKASARSSAQDAPNCASTRSLNEKSNDSEHPDTKSAGCKTCRPRTPLNPQRPVRLSGPGPPLRVCRDSESSMPRRITSQFTFELKHILRDARKMSSNFSNQIFQQANDSCNFQRSRSRSFAIERAPAGRSRKISTRNRAFHRGSRLPSRVSPAKTPHREPPLESRAKRGIGLSCRGHKLASGQDPIP